MKRKTHIVNPDIEEYLRGLTPSENEVLRKMEELGREKDFPIIWPLVGRLVYQLAVITGAKGFSIWAQDSVTRLLLSQKGFLTTIIPIRDGISLSVKL